jgi:predicted lipid-binding transport protein (Tim44 family)
MLRAVFDRFRRRGRRAPEPDAADLDLARFAALHLAVQRAWGEGDLAVLRQLTTPAMAAWFAEELARLERAGLRNVVADVEILVAEPREARQDGDTLHRTALLRWRARDYFVRAASADAAPQLISGDPRLPVEIEEMWTFARQDDGDWRLSAIDQV